MKGARILGLIGVFAAGAATALALGAGRMGGTPFSDREIAQAVVEQRAADAAARAWDQANMRAQRMAMDQTPAGKATGEPYATLLVQAMSGAQRAGVDAAVAKERLSAMRDAGSEGAKPAPK